MEQTLLIIVAAPLVASIIAGLLGKQIGRAATHSLTIAGVAIACALSVKVLLGLLDGAPVFDGPVYTWLVSDGIRMEVGFLVDRLSALMMVVVTFISLMVHIYTIGYMRDDPGYTRFFSYISLFTFSMLMLVMSNNLMQLFFGWEAVGVVSYLLIGFWYTKPTAIFANMKAFLVNRVGDFGFLLGIAGLVHLTGSLHYSEIFAQAGRIAGSTFELIPGHAWQAATVICIAPVHRRDGQVRAGAAARLAARFHGRPHADFGADPRGHDGHGRHLHGRADVAFVRTVGDRAQLRAGDRRDDGPVHGVPRHRQQRHQAGRGVLDAVPARLHDRGPGRLRVRGLDLPPDDARILQGAAVPRRRLGHHRDAPRAGHAQDGRPQEVHAHHVRHRADRFAGADRVPRLFRILLQGRGDRGGACLAPAGRDVRLLVPADRRVRHGVLLVPAGVHDVPRRGAHGPPHEGAFAREPLGGDAAVDPARNSVGDDRLAGNRAAAVRRLFPGGNRRRAGARRARPPGARIPRAGGVRPARAHRTGGLARSGGRARGVVPVPAATSACRRAAREGGRSLHAAREQVLLRLVQRERHRGRQSQTRHGALEGRRRRRDRRRGGQWFGPPGRVGGTDRPRPAVRVTSITTLSRRSSGSRSCSRGSSGEAEHQESCNSTGPS